MDEMLPECRPMVQVRDRQTGQVLYNANGQTKLAPAIGTAGIPMEIATNCLAVRLLPPGGMWYKYSVIIKSARSKSDDARPPPKTILRQIWRQLEIDERQRPTLFIGTDGKFMQPAFDGRALLYTPKQLGSTVHTRTVELIERDPSGAVVAKGGFVVAIVNCYGINMDAILGYVQLLSTDAREADFNDGLAAINTLFHHALALEFPTATRNVVYIHDFGTSGSSTGSRMVQGPTSCNVGAGLELLRGVFQSIRPVYDGLVLNLNITSGVFVKSGDLADLMKERLTGRGDVLCATSIDPRERIKLNRWLKGLVVRVSLPQGPRKFKIRVGISERSSRDYMFERGDVPGKISVAYYFKEHYNLRLRYPEWPVVEIKSGIVYPLELLFVLPGSRSNRRLTSDQQAKATRFQQLRPNECQAELERIREVGIFSCVKPMLGEWGVQISKNFRTIQQGRVLAPPLIALQRTTQVSNGSFRVNQGGGLIKGTQIYSYAVIFTGDERNRCSIGPLLMTLFGKMDRYGVRGPRSAPSVVVFCKDADPNVDAAVREAMDRGERCFRSVPEVIFWVFQELDPSLYALFKSAAMKRGIPSQALRGDAKQKLAKPGDQFAVNVALKLNGKLRGLNWILQPNRSTPTYLHDQRPMIWGIQVTHQEGKPSIAAVVASMDDSGMLMESVCSVQPLRDFGDPISRRPRKQEIIADLYDSTYALLNSYIRINGRLPPESMIMYRGGVSDSEWQAVLDEECAEIERAFRKFAENVEPDFGPWKAHVALVLCVRAHHVRFFPGGSGRGGFNVPPGLCIDEAITHPQAFDWYGVSQQGIIGTSRPTRYVLLRDTHTPKITIDQVQGMTNDLCYAFQRCSRAVSVPAPAYYAGIICSRVREMITVMVDDHALSSLGSSNDFAPRSSDYTAYENELSRLQAGMVTFRGRPGIPPAQWWL